MTGYEGQCVAEGCASRGVLAPAVPGARCACGERLYGPDGARYVGVAEKAALPRCGREIGYGRRCALWLGHAGGCQE